MRDIGEPKGTVIPILTSAEGTSKAKWHLSVRHEKLVEFLLEGSWDKKVSGLVWWEVLFNDNPILRREGR